MSVSTQELSRKSTSESVKTSLREGPLPKEGFSKLLKVYEVDENPHHSLFSLIEEEEEEEKSPSFDHLTTSCYLPPLTLGSIATTEPQSASIPLSASIELLFEKMASCMMVMDLSHETQTTLFLDNSQFADSPFFGTQIIIKEFTSAPKVFNIEIISNPTAIATIQKHQQSLAALFAQGNFLFTVHRLDTQIEQTKETPLLHRRHEEEEAGQQEQNKDQQP